MPNRQKKSAKNNSSKTLSSPSSSFSSPTEVEKTRMRLKKILEDASSSSAKAGEPKAKKAKLFASEVVASPTFTSPSGSGNHKITFAENSKQLAQTVKVSLDKAKAQKQNNKKMGLVPEASTPISKTNGNKKKKNKKPKESPVASSAQVNVNKKNKEAKLVPNPNKSQNVPKEKKSKKDKVSGIKAFNNQEETVPQNGSNKLPKQKSVPKDDSKVVNKSKKNKKDKTKPVSGPKVVETPQKVKKTDKSIESVSKKSKKDKSTLNVSKTTKNVNKNEPISKKSKKNKKEAATTSNKNSSKMNKSLDKKESVSKKSIPNLNGNKAKKNVSKKDAKKQKKNLKNITDEMDLFEELLSMPEKETGKAAKRKGDKNSKPIPKKKSKLSKSADMGSDSDDELSESELEKLLQEFSSELVCSEEEDEDYEVENEEDVEDEDEDYTDVDTADLTPEEEMELTPYAKSEEDDELSEGEAEFSCEEESSWEEDNFDYSDDFSDEMDSEEEDDLDSYDFEEESDDTDYYPSDDEDHLRVPNGAAVKYDVKDGDISFEDSSELQIIDLPSETKVVKQHPQITNPTQLPPKERKNNDAGNESDGSCPDLVPIDFDNDECADCDCDCDHSYGEEEETDEEECEEEFCSDEEEESVPKMTMGIIKKPSTKSENSVPSFTETFDCKFPVPRPAPVKVVQSVEDLFVPSTLKSDKYKVISFGKMLERVKKAEEERMAAEEEEQEEEEDTDNELNVELESEGEEFAEEEELEEVVNEEEISAEEEEEEQEDEEMAVVEEEEEEIEDVEEEEQTATIKTAVEDDKDVEDEQEELVEEDHVMEDEHEQSSEEILENVDESEEEVFEPSFRSKFYNSINSTKVILLLRDPIYIYGTLIATSIAGNVEIFGYTPKAKESVEVFSPKGYSSLSIKPKRSSGLQKHILEKELNSFAADFLQSDLKDILEEYDDQQDAILLLQRNDRNPIVRTMKKYMKENVFPNMNSISLDRTFYASEFILRCIITTICSNVLKEDPKWQTISVSSNTKMMIIGGKSVGKSTLARYLINSNLQKFPKVLLIDLDVGQPEMFVPQTISATLVTEPLLGPGYFQSKIPQKSLLVGDINVILSPQRYMDSVKELLAFCHSNEEFRDIPWIVNTMGYNKGIGGELVAAISRYLKPTEIVQLQSSRDINNFDYVMDRDVVKNINIQFFETSFDEEYVPAHRLIALNTIVNDGPRAKRGPEMTSKDIRHAMIIARLGASLSGHAEWLSDVKPISAPLDDLEIMTFGGENFDKEELAHTANGNLVYLTQKQPETHVLECYGIGIVRAVDLSEKTLYLVPACPVELLTNVNCLAIGNIPLPTCVIRNQGSKVTGTAPYIYNTQEFAATKSVKQIYHRPQNFLTGKRKKIIE